jgi:enoyl-CoA hydratase
MSPHARREDTDGVTTVTFTRPDKRNAVDHEMFDAIRTAVRDLRDQDHLRVLVLTAEGEYYTGGKDVADLRTMVGLGTDGTIRGSNMRAQYRADADHDLFDAIEQVEKPVILAAQGHCLGVGVEMGVSCDFRLAAEGATFGLPEVQNLAALPGSGGISRLTRIVGPHWARWMAMACERVDAREPPPACSTASPRRSCSHPTSSRTGSTPSTRPARRAASSGNRLSGRSMVPPAGSTELAPDDPVSLA